MTSSTPTLNTDSDGTRRWTLKGKLHRADGPAVERVDGTKLWFFKGKRHRTDGPAIEYADGDKEWWVNGKQHRIDGPAIEYANGARKWWVKGGLHRTDGPAIEWDDGSKEWWIKDKLHRTDGPATEWADGSKEWWVDGQEIGTPYSHVLTAAFNRGLPIPEEAVLEIARAATELLPNGEVIIRLKTILHKHWPMDAKKILAKLLSDSNPTIKHLAFALLGREAQAASISSVTGL